MTELEDKLATLEANVQRLVHICTHLRAELQRTQQENQLLHEQLASERTERIRLAQLKLAASQTGTTADTAMAKERVRQLKWQLDQYLHDIEQCVELLEQGNG